ncbi:hypothetical protein NDU88_008748 [Pleurodeles waltl]|uniref:Uncharacterized protein n=1 Tax=Pleurodeles waltl TaxID=8319 RepID=A0AAV7PQQ4_PLEWA|nr:hypothetical protein NDU88_008748 [Pleurodeles waltl]
MRTDGAGAARRPPLSYRDLNTEEGAEACGRGLSRGLKLRLNPGLRCPPRPAMNQRQGLTVQGRRATRVEGAPLLFSSNYAKNARGSAGASGSGWARTGDRASLL